LGFFIDDRSSQQHLVIKTANFMPFLTEDGEFNYVNKLSVLEYDDGKESEEIVYYVYISR
jgi:hypothetical protein